MSDEGKAAVVICLWTLAFHAGMFIAAGINKPIGLMLMGCATLVFAVYLRADSRIEAERKRRRRYEQDCERRAKELLESRNR